MFDALTGVGVGTGATALLCGDAGPPGSVLWPPPIFPEHAASAAIKASDATDHAFLIEVAYAGPGAFSSTRTHSQPKLSPNSCVDKDVRQMWHTPAEGGVYKENFGVGSFYGATRIRTIAGAVFSEILHRHSYQAPEHTHAVPGFCLLLSGSYEEQSQDVHLVYAPMTVAFHPSGMSHRDTIGDGGAAIFAIDLPATWQEHIARYGIPRTQLSELHAGDAAWLALRLYDAYHEPGTSTIEVESLLFELCSHVALFQQDELSEPAWLRAVTARIAAQYYAVPDVRTLAAEAGVHSVHLTRTFRRFHHRTIGDYVMGLRIRDVCQALHETRASLATIAAEKGFADQSHLARVFKTTMKTTPARYRARSAARPERGG
jgi:AraC family transcriptional regulator